MFKQSLFGFLIAAVAAVGLSGCGPKTAEPTAVTMNGNLVFEGTDSFINTGSLIVGDNYHTVTFQGPLEVLIRGDLIAPDTRLVIDGDHADVCVFITGTSDVRSAHIKGAGSQYFHNHKLLEKHVAEVQRLPQCSRVAGALAPKAE